MNEPVSELKANISAAYSRKRSAALAVCLHYAGLALQNFRMKQANNKYWTNRTKIAYDTVFSGGISERDVVGFFLAHAVEYGVYLELANDRRHEALLPTISGLYSRFIRDLGAIYAD